MMASKPWEKVSTSQKARSSVPQGTGECSRIQRDWMPYVATENKVTNNYENVRRETKCYASSLKPICSY